MIQHQNETDDNDNEEKTIQESQREKKAKIAWGKIFQRKRATSNTRQTLRPDVGATSNKENESLNYSSTDSSGTHEQKLRPSTSIRTTKDLDNYQQATIRRRSEVTHKTPIVNATRISMNKQRFTQIKLKTHESINLPFGDDIHEATDGTELRGDEKQIERCLQILLRSHERKQHFSKLKAILKPKEAGGLSYILVPENFDIDEYPYDPDTVEKWEAVHDHDAVQTYIQKRNLQHFGQAQGTPFTTEPLTDINWQANSIEAKEIINGAVPTKFIIDNPRVRNILRYLADRKHLPEIDTHVTAEQVEKGFR
jgi:hypothetical protein